MSHRKVFAIDGVDCAVCAAKIEKEVSLIDDITSSNVDLLNNRFEIISNKAFDRSLTNRIKAAVKKGEQNAAIKELDSTLNENHHRFNPSLITLIFSLTLFVIAFFTGVEVSKTLLFIAYFFSGFDVLYKAIRNLLKKQFFDENFLMSIATIGALAIGDFTEAVAVMLFYKGGEYLQHSALHKSKKSISELIDFKINKATLVKGEALTEVDVKEVEIGDTLLIRPGEKVPVDAIVTKGSSTLDTKAITGESLPLVVNIDDKIISGSIVTGQAIHAIATTDYKNSTVATILKLVEESSFNKAKSERFITRFARYYTPVVVVLALLIAFVGPLVTPLSFNTWFYRALVFLVISCPCALVVSIPLGFFGGIGGLSRIGVLTKGGNFIQSMANAKTVVFDKTGTLTKGVFEVTEIKLFTDKFTELEILDYASAVESYSNHPIAKAIVEKKSPTKKATLVHQKAGYGISAQVGGKKITIGALRYLENELARNFSDYSQTLSTEVFVAIEGEIVGAIVVTDKLKKEAKAAIQRLKEIGVSNIELLSGDSFEAAKLIGEELEIENFKGELLPQDKVKEVERLLTDLQKNQSLIFVGDGVNDAPVLSRADVGIAMGALGSDAAIEAADVVIMGDNLKKIGDAITHSRRTLKIVKQNIFLAISFKVAVMILGVLGLASMWLAVFADTGVALLAILNSLRALKSKEY